jgi:probable HAF family extracellular repeat protein
MRCRRPVPSAFAPLLALLALVSLLAAAAPLPAQAQRYNVIDLGTLGGADTFPADINNNGQVVGSSTTAAGATRAFLWQNGVMTELAPLPADINLIRTNFDINNKGQILGIVTAVSDSGSSFLWLPTPAYGLPAGMNDLSSLSAARINDAGQIVGTAFPYVSLWLPAPDYGLSAGTHALFSVGGETSLVGFNNHWCASC